MSTDPHVPDAATLAVVRDAVLDADDASIDFVMDRIGLPFRVAGAALQQLKDDGYLLPTQGTRPREIHPEHRRG